MISASQIKWKEKNYSFRTHDMIHSWSKQHFFEVFCATTPVHKLKRKTKILLSKMLVFKSILNNIYLEVQKKIYTDKEQMMRAPSIKLSKFGFKDIKLTPRLKCQISSSAPSFASDWLNKF